MPWAVWSPVTVPVRVTVRPGSMLPAVSSGSSRTTLTRRPIRIRPFRIRPDRHPPDVLVGGEVRDQQLERVVGLERRRRRDRDEQVEERPQVRARAGRIARRRARLGVGVDDRELDLVLVGAEVHEQLVDVVEDLGRPGVAAVDLVEGDDDRQMPRHRLLEHVAGLGQRALGRVDEEEDRVDHQQAPLDLAAEVGVARGVDDVEADAGVVDRRLLGEDRDPLLALQVHRVHDPVDKGLVRPERARLAEHRVDERRLAVVDMGDDRDVPEVGADRRPDRGRRGGRHGAADLLEGGAVILAWIERNGRRTVAGRKDAGPHEEGRRPIDRAAGDAPVSR